MIMTKDTVKVKPWGNGQAKYIVLNKDDFNPDIHELFVEEEKPKRKYNRTKK
jgi:hypothetical protein